MDLIYESKKIRNEPKDKPKLVAPPAIGEIRKSPRVRVNSTLLVKRSRERPIDKDKIFRAPAQNVQRKITFIFNNLTELNYRNKVNIKLPNLKYVQVVSVLDARAVL